VLVTLGLCVAVISLDGNSIGAETAAAIGAGLHGVPSLTSLEYVMQAWEMGRGQAEWCDGECVQVCVCGVDCECVLCARKEVWCAVSRWCGGGVGVFGVVWACVGRCTCM
jgi:hypothetical protein